VVRVRDMRGKVSRRRGTGDSSSELASAGERCKAFGLSPSGIPVRFACGEYQGLGAQHCFVAFVASGVELEWGLCRLCRDCYGSLLAAVCRSRGFYFGSWISRGLRSARVCFREAKGHRRHGFPILGECRAFERSKTSKSRSCFTSAS